MRRRSGQSGTIIRKGRTWHVRFYVDVLGSEKRERRSEPVGPATGKEKLTKPEAARKGAEIVASSGANTPKHLERATRPTQTFEQRVNWCRKYHKAWTDGKPGPIETMEGQLTKHVLPRFGNYTVDMIDETAMQEFVAELKGTKFVRRRKDGSVLKRYFLSRKTVLNIVGVIKLVLGRKHWRDWELDLGKVQRQRQPYFTEAQLKQIIDAAPERYRVLFVVLAGTGMRIGEALALNPREDLDLDNGVIYVRRSVWRGHELTPKTENGVRPIDIDPVMVETLRTYLAGCGGGSKRTLLLQSSRGRRCRTSTSETGCWRRCSRSSGFRGPGSTRSDMDASRCSGRTGRPATCRSCGLGTPASGPRIATRTLMRSSNIGVRRPFGWASDRLLDPMDPTWRYKVSSLKGR